MEEDKIPFPDIELTDKDWRDIRSNPKIPIIYTHCRHCMTSLPKGESPESWSRLTGIINLHTGVLTIGCMRCELPILSALVHPGLVDHLNEGCPCELCRAQREESNADG